MQINSKGQVTIFIIVGLLILSVFGLFLYLQSRANSINDVDYNLPLELAPIKNYIDSCIGNELKSGAYLLANNGGYIYQYNYTFDTEFEKIAYHIIDENIVSPSLEYSESELNRFIEDSIILCANGLTNFEGFTFEFGEPKADSNILGGEIVTEIQFPIKVIQQDKRTTISNFKVDTPITLGKLIHIKDEILSQIEKSGDVNLNLLLSSGAEINILPYDGETTIYALIQNQTIMQERPLIYQFAIKQNIVQNTPPVVEELDIQNAYVNEVFNLRIAVADLDEDTLTFDDRTALFDINPDDGQITFIPTPRDIGYYEIPIIVSDGTNVVEKAIKINIMER